MPYITCKICKIVRNTEEATEGCTVSIERKNKIELDKRRKNHYRKNGKIL